MTFKEMAFMTKQDFMAKYGPDLDDLGVKIITHDDLDGYSAAMVAADWLINTCGVKRKHITISHHNYENAPTIVDALYNLFIVTDYSVTNPSFAQSMLDLAARAPDKLIWIDHHQSSIDKCAEASWRPLKKAQGIRCTEYCATYLAWKYFHPNERVPNFIKLVDDFDCWKQNIPASKNLAMAFSFCPDFDKNEFGQKFQSLLRMDSGDSYFRHVMTKGLQYNEAMPDILNGYMRMKGYMAQFKDGPYKDKIFPCINSCGTGSDSLGRYLDKYKIGCVFYWNGSSFTISFYGKGSNGLARKICEHYGGGGHPDAAGFNSTTLPFKKHSDLEDLT